MIEGMVEEGETVNRTLRTCIYGKSSPECRKRSVKQDAA
jgi:hypothetical protein